LIREQSINQMERNLKNLEKIDMLINPAADLKARARRALNQRGETLLNLNVHAINDGSSKGKKPRQKSARSQRDKDMDLIQ